MASAPLKRFVQVASSSSSQEPGKAFCREFPLGEESFGQCSNFALMHSDPGQGPALGLLQHGIDWAYGV